MRSGQMLENKKLQLLVHCEPWPFWPWMDEWHYCFSGDELILAGKKILVKTNWFSLSELSELSKNGRVIRFKISALHREPPWHFPSFLAAWYLRCVLLRLAAAIAALTKVSVKRARGLPDRRGSGGRWGQTHGHTARHRVIEAVTMVIKVRCFWVPLRCDVVGGIADVVQMMCFTPVTTSSHQFLPQPLRSISLFSRIWLESIFKLKPSFGRGGAVPVPGFPLWTSFGNDRRLFYLISRSSSFSHCCRDFLQSPRFSHRYQPSTSSFSSHLSSASFTHVMLFIRIASSCLTGNAP